jgi:hypothetical protein
VFLSDNLSPQSVVLSSIYDDFDTLNWRIPSFRWGILLWEGHFSDLLPADVIGLVCVLTNTCGQTFTFAIDGPNATFLGDGNLHDGIFDSLVVETRFDVDEFASMWAVANDNSNQTGQCDFSLSIYPTVLFRDAYTSFQPEYFTLALLALFAFTGIVFLIFVYVSRNRQNRVMAIALSTSAIVASMFPATVRDRIMQDAEAEAL